MAVFPPAVPVTPFRRRSEAEQAADVGRRSPLSAQFAQAGGSGRFGQLCAVDIQHQPVMPVDRLRQTKQRLQQPMHAGRPEQVPALGLYFWYENGRVDSRRPLSPCR